MPARHKPRHPTMRPHDAVAPARKVGVVDANIPDRPCQQAHSPRLNPARRARSEPQDKKLWQIQSDAPLTDIERWMWAKHPSLAAALEIAIFEFDDATMA
jgi:hypothetical protein